MFGPGKSLVYEMCTSDLETGKYYLDFYLTCSRSLFLSPLVVTFLPFICVYSCPWTGSVWIYLFILSKVPELGDTVFLVMRKSNLIFLHWFHHFLTHINSWMAWGYVHEVGGSFAVMNFGVHSLMYTYFALTSFTRIRFPKWMRMMITGLQVCITATFAIVLSFLSFHQSFRYSLFRVCFLLLSLSTLLINLSATFFPLFLFFSSVFFFSL